MAESGALRDALKARFYPWLEARGFLRGKSSWLETVFRRCDGQVLHVFDIQWDKYHRPRFVINFGEIARPELRVSEEEVETWHCHTLGSLKPRNCPYSRCWFQLRKPWIEAIRSGQLSYEADEVADQVIALFPEVEAWWAERREGPHLQIFPRVLANKALERPGARPG